MNARPGSPFTGDTHGWSCPQMLTGAPAVKNEGSSALANATAASLDVMLAPIWPASRCQLPPNTLAGVLGLDQAIGTATGALDELLA